MGSCSSRSSGSNIAGPNVPSSNTPGGQYQAHTPGAPYGVTPNNHANYNNQGGYQQAQGQRQRPSRNRGSSQNDRGKRKPQRKAGPPRSRSRDQRQIQFADFNDNEKDVVDRILERSHHLQMAKINFDDLKLIKIIGTGAFGEVIKGEYCGTPVVVKRMLRNKINEQNMRMLAEEIQLMMGLRHPNIVQFIGASWNSYSNVCYVTEFLERGDLYSVLRDPKLKLTWADPLIRMAVDSCRGMAYLHSMQPPILHRDLKSMNILVSATFGCKISDFGLSRAKSIDETMSVTGTPLWLPPEMIKGDKYSEKADVYSFGIVLTEMDTRKIPYHDVKAKGARKKRVSGTHLMHMVAYENLRPSVTADCLVSLKRLIERCVDQVDTARPTFEEIIEEFETNIRKEAFDRQAEEESKTIEEKKRELTSRRTLPDDHDVAAELGVKVSTTYTSDYQEAGEKDREREKEPAGDRETHNGGGDRERARSKQTALEDELPTVVARPLHADQVRANFGSEPSTGSPTVAAQP